MRHPEDVVEQASTRYQAAWRDALLGDTTSSFAFALKPPSVAVITTRSNEVSAWLLAWRRWAARNPDVELRTRRMRTPFGEQPVVTHLDIPGIDALAALSPNTHEHWRRAGARWTELRGQTNRVLLRPWLTRIINLDDHDFTILLAAIAWFRANPNSGLTVRSAPVPGMHTKWLSRHRAMLIACLTDYSSISPDQLTESNDVTDPVDIPTLDLDALGLRPLARQVAVVLADPALRTRVGGLRQIIGPVDELGQLAIEPDAVLIIENKEPALAWSDTPGLLIIHSLGNHLNVLEGLPWIPSDRSWYWGDLDRHGFTLLSRARKIVPQLESLLMSHEHVESYRSLSVEERLDRYDAPEPTLTKGESAALSALDISDRNFLRVEQERIPLDHAIRALAQSRSSRRCSSASSPPTSSRRPENPAWPTQSA